MKKLLRRLFDTHEISPIKVSSLMTSKGISSLETVFPAPLTLAVEETAFAVMGRAAKLYLEYKQQARSDEVSNDSVVARMRNRRPILLELITKAGVQLENEG